MTGLRARAIIAGCKSLLIVLFIARLRGNRVNPLNDKKSMNAASIFYTMFCNHGHYTGTDGVLSVMATRSTAVAVPDDPGLHSCVISVHSSPTSLPN
jgi:hypothetical protein